MKQLADMRRTKVLAEILDEALERGEEGGLVPQSPNNYTRLNRWCKSRHVSAHGVNYLKNYMVVFNAPLFKKFRDAKYNKGER